MSIDLTPNALIRLLDEASERILQFREQSLYALAARMIERLQKENKEARYLVLDEVTRFNQLTGQYDMKAPGQFDDKEGEP